MVQPAYRDAISCLILYIWGGTWPSCRARIAGLPLFSVPTGAFVSFCSCALRAGQGRGGLSGRITMKFGEETGAEETNDR